MNKSILNTHIRTSNTRGRRMMMASATAAIVATLSLAGISYADETKTPQTTSTATKQHDGKHARMSPEQKEKRAERMITRLVPDATPEQKTRLAAIAKTTFGELRPLNQQIRAARADSMKLLSQPTIDRNALEQARQKQQKLADQRSSLISKGYADAAEVLTPAQRVKVAEKLAKKRHHFGHHGFRHHHHGQKGDAPAVKKAE